MSCLPAEPAMCQPQVLLPQPAGRGGGPAQLRKTIEPVAHETGLFIAVGLGRHLFHFFVEVAAQAQALPIRQRAKGKQLARLHRLWQVRFEQVEAPPFQVLQASFCRPALVGELPHPGRVDRAKEKQEKQEVARVQAFDPHAIDEAMGEQALTLTDGRASVSTQCTGPCAVVSWCPGSRMTNQMPLPFQSELTHSGLA